jgi:hypothetical protein
MATEVSVSRRTFMRQLATTVGAGLGIVALQATKAMAVNNCCRDSTCPTCPGAKVRYRCTDSCVGGTCCICHTNVGNCFNGGPCPCG